MTVSVIFRDSEWILLAVRVKMNAVRVKMNAFNAIAYLTLNEST